MSSPSRQLKRTSTGVEDKVPPKDKRVAGRGTFVTKAAYYLARLRRLGALIWVRAYATLRAEISRSYLGYIWWVVEPTLYMGAFWLAFAEGLRGGSRGSSYVSFLLCGLVPWKWFATSFMGAGSSIFGNKGLMLQINLPKIVLPLSVIAANTFKFLITLTLLLIFLLLYTHDPKLSWLYAIAVFFCEGIFIVGTGILLSSLIPLLPDINSIMQNVMLLLFFLSGIFFDIQTIKGPARLMFHLDPMAVVITSWRDVLLHGKPPQWSWLSMVVAVGLICLIIGLRLIKHFEQRYAKMGN